MLRTTLTIFLTFCCSFLLNGQNGPVSYTAKDSVVHRVDLGKSMLYNQVVVKFNDVTLEAGYAEIDWNTNTVVAMGITDSAGVSQMPVFKESDRTFYMEHIAYNWNSGKTKIKKVLTQEGGHYLNGKAMKMVDTNTIYMAGTGFTSCTHEEPHFQIVAGKSKIQTGERIITGPAHFEFMGIPTPLVIPYGYFPTNMEKPSITGLLMPSFQNNPVYGMGLINGGWYFNLGDHMDLALRGDLYLRGSWALSAKTQYATRYKYNGSLELSYRYNKTGLPIYDPFGKYNTSKNFSITWNHRQDQKAHPTRKFNASVNLKNPNFFKNGVSSQDLLAGTLTTTNNTMRSSITIDQKIGRANLNITTSHTQNNGTTAFTTELPKASLNVPRFFPLKTNDGKNQWYDKLGVNYSSTATSRIKGNIGTIQAKMDSLGYYGMDDVLGEYGQYGINHKVSMATSATILKYISFSPNMNFTERWYFQQYDYSFDPATNKATVQDTAAGFYAVRDFGFNASMGTKIYGVFDIKRGPLKAVRHMMSPNVSFNYRPDFGDEVWNYYQIIEDTLGVDQYYSRYHGFIYGTPGFGSNGQISFRLDNNIEAKLRGKRDSTLEGKKVKLLDKLNISTSYNLASTTGYNWNKVKVNANSTFFKGKLRVNYRGDFDPYGYDETGSRVPVLATAMHNSPLIHRTSTLNASMSLMGRKTQGRVVEYENRGGAFTTGDIDYFNYPTNVYLRNDWDLSLNYNYALVTDVQAAETGTVATFSHRASTHAIGIRGSYKPTDAWALTFNTGFDLNDMELAQTTITAVRDLHCWQMNITWIPVGAIQSYAIGISLKSPQFKQVQAKRTRQSLNVLD